MKKIALLFIVCFTLINCGGDSGTITPTPPPEVKKPVAVDDAFAVTEDQPFIISNLKANDKDAAAATVKNFDATTTGGGTIVDNRNNTYTYTSATSFVGTDTFTYTICDTKTPQNCSTATVTLTVADEGSPTAVDDAYNTNKNQALTLTDFLANDALTDDAKITSVDGSSSTGTVLLNSDETISYTPKTDFIGSDSFTYTLCDDDQTQQCVTGTITIKMLAPIAFNIPAPLDEYYATMIFSEDADLTFDLLRTFTTDQHSMILSYGQRHTYLYNADADLVNADNVVLMYSGEKRFWKEYTSGTNPYSPQTFNTEHIFPQSKLNTADAVTDLHHLRSADATINSDRSNFPFTDGAGSYGLVDGNKWYPGDDWRGDVARMVLYLHLRYGEEIESVGTLALFLKWNKEDMVSPFELQRNNVIEGAQGNRNPFIDNPYIATLIWGGDAAENKWE